jgi:hypothetical protein
MLQSSCSLLCDPPGRGLEGCVPSQRGFCVFALSCLCGVCVRRRFRSLKACACMHPCLHEHSCGDWHHVFGIIRKIVTIDSAFQSFCCTDSAWHGACKQKTFLSASHVCIQKHSTFTLTHARTHAHAYASEHTRIPLLQTNCVQVCVYKLLKCKTQPSHEE